ncbi:hypothetical protein CQW23_34064 [Capsicum baccatum]|uniref:Uncharacterized protein n=1 Tax=Capsicum baccatum TaxID=33114 RepID=A0A2G2V034_CAPBA|nr:hypothetical protein CQW23_34064 [Capsicum baccatum]
MGRTAKRNFQGWINKIQVTTLTGGTVLRQNISESAAEVVTKLVGFRESDYEFRNTGLERSEVLEKDLEWFRQQGPLQEKGLFKTNF